MGREAGTKISAQNIRSEHVRIKGAQFKNILLTFHFYNTFTKDVKRESQMKNAFVILGQSSRFINEFNANQITMENKQRFCLSCKDLKGERGLFNAAKPLNCEAQISLEVLRLKFPSGFFIY